MPTYQENHRTAADLTAQARAAADLAALGYRLGRFLPSRDNFSLTYDFNVNDIGLTDLAEYRAFDTEANYGQGAASGGARSGALPPVSRKYRVKEQEQLQLFIGGTSLIGDKQDEYARKGGTAIAARVALAQAQAIEFAKVTLKENKLDVTIDYGRNAAHNVIAAQQFTDPDADLIDELESYAATYRAANGTNPGTTLVSQRIITALSKNKSVIGYAVGRSDNLPSRVAYPDVISFLAAYGFLGVEVFDAVLDKTRLLSDNKMFLLPSDETATLDGGPLGTTEWGITAESIQPVYKIADAERPGIFSAAFDDNDPQGTDVLSTAVVIPALTNADATFVVQVIPAA